MRWEQTMADDFENRLVELSEQFRQAMDICDKSLWGEQFAAYPMGCCGQVAEMLGVYFEENLGTTAEYVWGDLPTPERYQSHAWVEIAGYIVDVVADQFGGPAVVVTKDHRPYERWQRQERGTVATDMSAWAQYGARPLADIKQQLDALGIYPQPYEPRPNG